MSLYRKVKVAIINSSLESPYHSYGDHWYDGFQDAGCEIEVFKYGRIPVLPLKFDLYFFVEIRYNTREIPWYANPRVLYSWDSHVTGIDCLKPVSKDFDYIALASKIDTEELNKQGFANFVWVPEACNPRLHRDFGRERTVPIGLVGNPDESRRRHGYIRNDFIATFIREYKGEHHTYRWGPEYVDLMNNFLISFDRVVAHNVGTRVFEAAAMGCIPLWADSGISDQNGMNQLMVANEHYVPYDDTIDGFKAVVDSILADPEKYRGIAAKGKAHVLANHSYANRARQILDIVKIPWKEI